MPALTARGRKVSTLKRTAPSVYAVPPRVGDWVAGGTQNFAVTERSLNNKEILLNGLEDGKIAGQLLL
jgi:hypothetical protein